MVYLYTVLIDLKNPTKGKKVKPNKPTLVPCYRNSAAAGKNERKWG